MNPIFIPLKAEYFDQFEAGTKDTEYRKYGPRWNEKTCPVGRKVVLSYGYGKKRRLSGEIVKFTRVFDALRLPGWIACYGATAGDAACIKIKLERLDATGVSFMSDDSAGDWPEDFTHENGNYMRQCCECGNKFMGYKRRQICKKCSTAKANERA